MNNAETVKKAIILSFLKERRHLVLIAFKYLLNWEDAEDLVQEVFIKVWQLASKVENENIGGYIYSAVIRSCHQFYRDQKKQQILNDQYEQLLMWEPPDNPERDEEIRTLLVKALECLPPMMQRDVVCHYLKGEKQKDIALRFGISYQVVKGRVSQGVKRLREDIQERR